MSANVTCGNHFYSKNYMIQSPAILRVSRPDSINFKCQGIILCSWSSDDGQALERYFDIYPKWHASFSYWDDCIYNRAMQRYVHLPAQIMDLIFTFKMPNVDLRSQLGPRFHLISCRKLLPQIFKSGNNTRDYCRWSSFLTLFIYRLKTILFIDSLHSALKLKWYSICTYKERSGY